MKHAFSITIEKDLYDQLKRLADEDNRTISNLVELLLYRAIEEEKVNAS